jgi:hypothetical protein
MVEGLRLWIIGVESKIKGLEFRDQEVRHRVQGVGLCVQGLQV